MVKLGVDIEVTCSECGAVMRVYKEEDTGGGCIALQIDPCGKCGDVKYEEGKKDQREESA
jgi:cytidine deaminase